MVYFSNEAVVYAPTPEEERKRREFNEMMGSFEGGKFTPGKLTAGMSEEQLKTFATAGGPVEMIAALFKIKLPDQAGRIDNVVSQWRAGSGFGGQQTSGPDGSPPTQGMGLIQSIARMFR